MKGTAQQVDSGILAWMECVKWTLCGSYCTAGGQWYCNLNMVCFIEHLVEGPAQQVDSGILVSMACFTVNIMWKLLQSSWTVVLQLECSVLQWTSCGRYSTAGGQLYCSLNGVCFSEHYVEGIAQFVNSGIIAWMECFTVNNMSKILHSSWTALLKLECSVLEWTLCGRYCTVVGQWYCSLNGVCYSEHYVEDTA